MAGITVEVFDSRLKAILTAIPGDDPGGTDVRDEDISDDIDDACKELSRPGAEIGDDTDFSWVDSAEKLLVEKSKDIKVLTQWMYGLVLRDKDRVAFRTGIVFRDRLELGVEHAGEGAVR